VVQVQRELGPLVRALNHFTERLRGQFERQAQFIADAAHELRTPLAALKARVELGLRSPSRRSGGRPWSLPPRAPTA
jgi:two-component system sensor histidine kinase TctE